MDFKIIFVVMIIHCYAWSLSLCYVNLLGISVYYFLAKLLWGFEVYVRLVIFPWVM